MRTHDNEPFVVNRDIKAIVVPAGVEVNLHSGQSGYITQALGGSFTVYIEGNLFRIAGEDADAIGKEAVKPPALPPITATRRGSAQPCATAARIPAIVSSTSATPH